MSDVTPHFLKRKLATSIISNSTLSLPGSICFQVSLTTWFISEMFTSSSLFYLSDFDRTSLTTRIVIRSLTISFLKMDMNSSSVIYFVLQSFLVANFSGLIVFRSCMTNSPSELKPRLMNGMVKSSNSRSPLPLISRILKKSRAKTKLLIF